jgi:exonuclease III
MPIHIATYNCQNIQTSINEVRELCRSHDVIFLQETWLLPTDISMLQDIDSNFHAKGLSSVNVQKELLIGRPFGGIAVLWSKYLGNMCKPVLYGDDSSIMGLELTISSEKYLFINVYMPYSCADNQDEFVAGLSKIDSIVQSSDTPFIFVLGDFNADPTKDHLFGQELVDFCQDANLIITDVQCLKNSYTFYSCPHNTTSWLDHAVCTPSAGQLVQSCRIHFDKISSDHFPLSLSININCIQASFNINQSSGNFVKCINWDKLSSLRLKNYAAETERYLSKINLCKTLSSCQDYHCQNHDHLASIDKMYDDICSALHSASKDLVDRRCTNKHNLPGWNEMCKESHQRAREAFLLWRAHGSPRQGLIFENMKKLRSQFKLSLRQCKRAKDQKIVDAMAEKFAHKHSKSLWKDIRRVQGNENQGYATTIAGASGPSDICDMWCSYYKDLLNSTSNNSLQDSVMTRLQNVCACETFSPSDIKEAIKNLKKDTSPGKDGIYSEHFIFASEQICLYVSLFLTV